MSRSLVRALAAAAALLTACTGPAGPPGANGSDGAGGKNSLVEVVAEPPGAHCAEGGQVIRVGLDLDGDGLLDPAEVTATTYVCNGASAVAWLNRLDVEPDGPHCSAGGTAIRAGPDTNGDGVLGDPEIAQTSYVCNGVPSTACGTLQGSITIRNAIDWHNLLRAGCTAVTGKLEIAAPGLITLDGASPITSVGWLAVEGSTDLTTFSLPALTTVAHDVRVADDAALNALELPALATVHGSLGLGGGLPALGTVVLTALQAVDGDLWISGMNPLTSLSLPALVSVGGNASIMGNDALARVELPALAVVGTDFELQGAGLVAPLLPALTSIGGRLSVTGSPALTDLVLPVLEQVGSSIYLTGCDVMATLAAPRLVTVGSWVNIGGAPLLTTLDVPRLAAVGSFLQVTAGEVTVLRFPALASVGGFVGIFGLSLTELALPALRSGQSLYVQSSPALATLDLSSLERIEWDLDVSWNAKLGRLSAPALTTVGGWLRVRQNGALAGLDLPALTAVNTLWVTDDPALPECQALALKDRLVAAGSLPGGWTISGNDTTATCP